MEELNVIGQKARKAATQLAHLNTEQKNRILSMVADLLEKYTDGILEANTLDLKQGKKMGLTGAIMDRLTLSGERISGIADGLREIVQLDEIDVIDPQSRQRELEIGTCLSSVSFIRLRREKDPVSIGLPTGRTGQPGRHHQLAVAIGRCGIEVVDTCSEHRVEHCLGPLLSPTLLEERRCTKDDAATAVTCGTEGFLADHGANVAHRTRTSACSEGRCSHTCGDLAERLSCQRRWWW